MTGVIGALTSLFGWVMPDWQQLLLLLAAGVFGALSNLFIAESLRRAHASVTAPFEYTTLVWSAVISYLVFDSAPGMAVVAGGLLVAGSGLFTVWLESRFRPPARPS